MLAKEYEKAQEPAEVEKLLDRVENHLETDYQKTAYNFMIDYLERPEAFSSHEGGRLVLLSLEVLHGIKSC